jgi:peroxiredoxin
MRKLICFLIILFPLVSNSQIVEITGNASFFKNEQIHVFQYTNLLAEKKQLIKKITLPESGNYKLSFELDEPQELIIKIEMRELHLHVHPNSSIQLNFHPITNASNQRNPLQFTIQYENLPKNIAPDSVYHLLKSDFANKQLDIELGTDLVKFYQDFFNHSDSVYQNYILSDTLFATYYRYFKADAFLQTSIPHSQLIREYIIDKPIAYWSREYLTFFKFVMGGRLNTYLSKNPKTVDQIREKYKIYDELIRVTAYDSLLGNEETRSLAILMYTKSNSSSTYFDAKTKASIISQYGNFCPFPIQSDVARTFQTSSNPFKINQEAPIFELEDKSGKLISLQSFRGKPIYLGFIHSKSRTCQKDLLALDALRKKYRKIQFLMVLCDRDSILTNQIPKETNNLKFLYLNKTYTVLEQYQIWNFPVYYLLDKHGYFIESPASKPLNMFETFTIMSTPKSKRKKYEIIKP